MNATSSIRLDDTTTQLHAQRACFAPSNRELSLLLQAKYGRGLDAFKSNELAIARVVFAQVALMAGAALASDSETFFGAEQLWRDMQDHIGPQERALAKHFLQLLSKDEYYSASERHLIGALALTLPLAEDESIKTQSDLEKQNADLDFTLPNIMKQPLRMQPEPGTQSDAGVRSQAGEKPKTKHQSLRASIKLDDSTVAKLRVQRDGFAPSDRELAQFLQAGKGRGLDAFGGDELAIARVVFAQVALMTGAALAADTETYIGAEQLWCEMQDSIGPRERTLARHFLDLLSRDQYYTQSERHLIECLSAALPESDEVQAYTLSGHATPREAGARAYIN